MRAKLMSTPPSINESFDSFTKESLFTDTLTPTESLLLIKPQNQTSVFELQDVSINLFELASKRK